MAKKLEDGGAIYGKGKCICKKSIHLQLEKENHYLICNNFEREDKYEKYKKISK